MGIADNAGKGAIVEAEKTLIPELEQDAEKVISEVNAALTQLIGQVGVFLAQAADYEIVVSLRKKTQGESK